MREFGAEWFADAIVHTTGFAIGLIACLVLAGLAIWRSRSASHPDVRFAVRLSFALYGLGLIAMLTCSALYNLYVDHPQRELLRRLDHAAIFLMIAGTFTPFALMCLRGPKARKILGGVWALAILGVVLKLAAPDKFEVLSLPAYLALGWAVVLIFRHIRATIPSPGLPLLAAGCVLYTLGMAFYLWTGLQYQLAIWHAFVLAAAACHFACIVGYATGPTAVCRACDERRVS